MDAIIQRGGADVSRIIAKMPRRALASLPPVPERASAARHLLSIAESCKVSRAKLEGAP